MRIAVFSDNFHPELSGITDSIITLARELARRGHVLHIFAPRYTHADYGLLGLPAGEIDLGDSIAVKRLASLPYPTGTGQGRMVLPAGHGWRLLRRFRPDVVHVHLPFGVGIEGVMGARLLGMPLVGTNHTPISEFLRYSPIRARWLGRAAARYTSWFYNHCDFVSSPARLIFAEMEAFHFHAPHRVMSNPIRLDAFAPLPDREGLKKTFGFSDAVILYAGRLAPEKRVDLVVRAVAALASAFPTIRLVLLGRGRAENDLKALCRSLGIEERVTFLGFIPDVSRMAQIYNASDMFVIASTADTQSIAAMQAMACALPVVAVRSWGLTEYITDADGILVEPGDVSALAASMAHLLRHPETRARLGKGGRAFVQGFSIETVAAEWEGLYREVVEQPRRRPDRIGDPAGRAARGGRPMAHANSLAAAAERSRIS